MVIEMGMDSMSGYLLCSKIEKKYHLILDFNTMMNAQTVRELSKVVEDKTQPK